MPESREFSYGPVPVALAYALHLGLLAFLIWELVEGDQKIACLVILAVLLPEIVVFCNTPTRFAVVDGLVTASWLWGRKRSWPVADIRVPNAGRRLAQAYMGGLDVLDRDDRRVFRVYLQLQNYREFLEILAPGTQTAQELRASRSWWNRNLG
jgi:hypothetical protein